MDTQSEQTAIEKLIFSFSDAFNAADISKTVASFTPDGINMPNTAPAAKGTEQLTTAFGLLFGSAQINIKYVIDEISVIGEHAFARTNSTVNTLIKATGDKLLLENKELFLLRKQDGEWKISHYIFNNTKTTR
ncbi:conserved hypothetical protein [Mucilaginibacter pineti]|uniref:SnoaL-like domain-containing protein n=1 Tax=Mucilaginibacter pineti TaxID=1391627 RepID=A0A1G6ZCT4_9SPHI|nr:nuclear transport factor 2 family protein [Mucilaginibacter pineti]SDD99546.1 conserved hypothetical protein [Mucilaginibacter pineti]